MWGPLVYTVEETDNGENLQALYIDTAKPVKKSEKEEFPMLIAAGKRICESGWARKNFMEVILWNLQKQRLRWYLMLIGVTGKTERWQCG